MIYSLVYNTLSNGFQDSMDNLPNIYCLPYKESARMHTLHLYMCNALTLEEVKFIHVVWHMEATAAYKVIPN